MLPHEFTPAKDGIMPRTLRNARLVTFDLATRAITNHAQPTFDVSVGQPRWSADGSAIWFTASDRVYNTIYNYTLATSSYAAMTKDLLVQGAVASRDGSKMAFVLDTPSWPSEVYVPGCVHADAEADHHHQCVAE